MPYVIKAQRSKSSADYRASNEETAIVTAQRLTKQNATVTITDTESGQLLEIDDLRRRVTERDQH